MRQVIVRWYKEFERARIEVEHSAQQWRLERGDGLDWGVIGVILVASIVLTIQDYFGASNDWMTLEPLIGLFVEDAKAWLSEVFKDKKYGRLARLWYWSLMTSCCYVIAPVLYIKFVLKDQVRDYGFRLKGTLKHAWIYVALFLIVLPALFVVGLTESFQRSYPFYKDAGRSVFDFVMWEVVYIAQFLSLEFFFRGFLVHALKRRFGFLCILVAVMPYCMIHFGKPMPETLGAIFAGIALGALSLLTRSIWLGVAIHVSVALSMDVISLFWPPLFERLTGS